MELTASQLDAIAHRDGHLQLIACAGSGKTEVVARRVARLLAPPPDGAAPVAPRDVVAFTFTDKAAGELKERIGARVRASLGELPGLAEMYVGTIHGFCLDLLRSEVSGFAGRPVLDEVAQRMLVERHPERSGRATARFLYGDALDAWKHTGVYLSALDVLRQAELAPDALRGNPAVDALAQWRALLEDRGYLDYTSILEHAARALESDEALRERLRARVRHVIVDEYQDVNPIQERVVRALADLGAWLCVVGDDDQSIFQWNGANITNILRFTERYPGARTVRLQENFRSSAAVVDLARAFIAQNRERLAKSMVSTGAQPHARGDIVARAFADPRAEAEWIADRFAELHGAAFDDGATRRGLAWSDFAVLVRMDLKRTAAPLVDAFAARGIPYVVSGLNNLFETREAQAAAGLFRFVGDAEVSAQALRAMWVEAVPRTRDEDLAAGVAYAEAVRDEVRFRDDDAADDLLPQRVFLEFLARLRVRVEGVPGERGRGQAMLANLGVFSRLLADFEGVHHHTNITAKYARLVEFLENTAKDQYAEGVVDAGVANPDAVRVLTVHKAKGLQWAVVAVPGMIEGRFPSVMPKGGDPAKKKRKDWWDIVPVEAVVGGERYRGDLDDERRLFYVAVTRARRWLLLTFAPRPEYGFWRRPSQFFTWAQRQPQVSAEPSAVIERATPTPKAGVSDARLDFTTVKSLFECPRRFQLQSVYGFSPPPEPAQGFGASIHDALAEVHRRALDGQRCTADDVPALLDDFLRLPFATPSVYARRREAAERVLRAYLRRHEGTLDRVEFVEKAIELPLGDGVSVAGRIDLVVRGDDGEASIVDFKSTAHAQSELQTMAQLHLYALGYKTLTGRDATAVEVWELDQGHEDRSPVDDHVLDGVRETVRAAAEVLREGRFDPSPERERCGRCAVRGLCDAGQRTYDEG